MTRVPHYYQVTFIAQCRQGRDCPGIMRTDNTSRAQRTTVASTSANGVGHQLESFSVVSWTRAPVSLLAPHCQFYSFGVSCLLVRAAHYQICSEMAYQRPTTVRLSHAMDSGLAVVTNQLLAPQKPSSVEAT